MSDQVALELEAGIALLTLNHPPTNSLTHDLRAELATHLETALRNDAVNGVLLRSTGDWFSAGWDLIEFHEADAPPSLSPISDLLENATKPTVAVLDGTVLSSGLELALCAHARVARAGTKIGIPEVNVGLMPGSGATQRLPRLIGAQASLKLLLGGKALDVSAPEMQGLIDRITEDNPEKQAKKLLRSMISRGKYQPVSEVSRGLSDAHGYQAAITSAREQIKVPDSAGTDILDCVEAALVLPFQQGLRFEESRYHERVKRKSARVQLHSFAAERYAKSLPNGFAASAMPVSHVAVIGNARLATDGAIMPLLLGHQVTVDTGDEAATQAALNRIQKRLTASFPQKATELVQSLMPATDTHGVAQAGLVIDCAEKSDKSQYEAHPRAVWLIANSDCTAKDRMAAGAPAKRTLRLNRLFPSAPFCELSLPKGCTKTAIATAHRALSRAGQNVILTGDTPIGVSGALFAVFGRTALTMLACGLSPDEVESAAKDLGFTHGPLLMIDSLGAGHSLRHMKAAFEARGAPMGAIDLLSDRVGANGTTGQHRAFVTSPAPNPDWATDLTEWLEKWRAARPEIAKPWFGATPKIAFHAALVNEACRLRDAGILQRMSDVDLAVEKGLMAKKSKGGPLIQSDLNGSLGLARAMAELRDIDPTLWRPQPRFADMVKNGKRFFEGQV